MQNKVLVLIDADGLLYQSSKETLEESINILDKKIQNIFFQTKATHYVMFISKGKYFRHNIDPLYKSNRKKYPTQLKWIKSLKAYLEENWNAQWMEGVEADDLATYWNNKKEWDVSSCISLWGVFDKILCSPDKDLLQSIPGKHFNYTYKLTDEAKQAQYHDENYVIKDEDVIKGWWVETSLKESDNFKKMQLIVGDSSDGISGVEGLGIKAWEKMGEDGIDSYIGILSKYLNKYGDSMGIYNFQKNYRLLHLLENDEDFIREVQKTPEFPIITKIQKEEEAKEIEF